MLGVLLGLDGQFVMVNVGAIAALLLLLAGGLPNENTLSAVVVVVVVVVEALGVAFTVAGLPNENNLESVEVMVVVAAGAGFETAVAVPKENTGAHVAVVAGALVATAGSAVEGILPNVNIVVAEVVIVGATATVVDVSAFVAGSGTLSKTKGFAVVVVFVIVVVLLFPVVKDIFVIKLVKPPTLLDVADVVGVVWLNDIKGLAILVGVAAAFVVEIVSAAEVTVSVDFVRVVVFVVPVAVDIGCAGVATIVAMVAADVTVAAVVAFCFDVVSGSSVSSPK